MDRRALLLLVLIAAAPLAAADVTYSGTVGWNAQSVPQLHCDLVQSAPRPASDPLACNQKGSANGITVLRVRGAGVGTMYAGLVNNPDRPDSTQLATVDCASTSVIECKHVFSNTNLGVSSSSVLLYARAWGGGGASWVVTVERVPRDAAVPT